jgi:hypothetical protein
VPCFVENSWVSKTLSSGVTSKNFLQEEHMVMDKDNRKIMIEYFFITYNN